MKKWILNIFFALTLLALLTPFWVFTDLLFPYVSSKAFYFRIVIELALPCYLYLVLVDKSLRPRLKNPLNIAVLAFLIINIISAYAGVNITRSLWGNFERMGGVYYIAHLVVLFFFVQLLGQAGRFYLKRFLQAFILVAVLVTLNGLSGWLGGPTVIGDPSLPARVSSTFGNPIFFASYLVVPMFLAAYLAIQEGNKVGKVFYWIAVAIQLVGIYSSGTRGAIVGLLVGFFVGAVVYVIATKQLRVRRYGMVVIVLFLALAGILYAYHSKLAPGSTLYRISNLKDSNTEARLIQWRIALSGFKDHSLLGTGSENYYVIFDKYFNPAIYQYDSSWFDKPHNFLIEVLTTNGLLGLVAYVSMVGFALYGLWEAYKAELLGLFEMCLLIAAVVAYQVQNLFVFDTVSASVAFYAFLGFATYMWAESFPPRVDSQKKSELLAEGGLAITAFVIACCLVVYAEFVSNISSMEVAKRVNYGYAYAQVDPQKAGDYFEKALALQFNMDMRETVDRYSDFVNGLVNSNVETSNPQLVATQVDKATASQILVTEQVKNDPLLWSRLANDKMDQAAVHGSNIDDSKPFIDQAIALAPKRAELQQLLLQYYGFKKDWKDAVPVAEKMTALNPYSPDLRWQLALVQYLNGQVEDAVKNGDVAVEQGYSFTQLQQFAWYIQYYEQKADYQKVIPLLEKAIALEPNELGLYVDLAKDYAAVGQKDHARLLLQQVEIADPSQKAAMEALIKSIK